MHSKTAALAPCVQAGDASIHGNDWGALNVAHISFPKGTDARPLLQGLKGDACHAPHWGYVLKGSIHVHYSDGKEEVVRAGEVYYWPPGHTVWVDEDYAAVEFSPAKEMGEVMAHLNQKLAAMAQPSQGAQAPGAPAH
jgi:hypothetical protein